MIYVTGDIHGNYHDLKQRCNNLTRKDILIICGDFGFIWSGNEVENRQLDEISKLEPLIAFVPGNHENYDLLKAYPCEKWYGGKIKRIRSNIIELLRGNIYEIGRKTFFCFGGAQSHDISSGVLELSDPQFESKYYTLRRARALFRVNHLSWWKEEMPCKEEYDLADYNLENHNWSVDYVVSHCAPTSIVNAHIAEVHWNFTADHLTDYFEYVKDKLSFSKWFFGHYHDDIVINEQFVLLYNTVYKIKQ